LFTTAGASDDVAKGFFTDVPPAKNASKPHANAANSASGKDTKAKSLGPFPLGQGSIMSPMDWVESQDPQFLDKLREMDARDATQDTPPMDYPADFDKWSMDERMAWVTEQFLGQGGSAQPKPEMDRLGMRWSLATDA
jgi:hypothetical protein